MSKLVIFKLSGSSKFVGMFVQVVYFRRSRHTRHISKSETGRRPIIRFNATLIIVSAFPCSYRATRHEYFISARRCLPNPLPPHFGSHKVRLMMCIRSIYARRLKSSHNPGNRVVREDLLVTNERGAEPLGSRQDRRLAPIPKRKLKARFIGEMVESLNLLLAAVCKRSVRENGSLRIRNRRPRFDKPPNFRRIRFANLAANGAPALSI